ncbi:MAG: beta-aspartyl-peptidase [Duodenibacillus sp.]|nr:beta-aspartyl-peptidase [Duodenibacillus sp.]
MSCVLIRRADVYGPEHLGINDLFIVNDKIVAMGPDLVINVPKLEVFDAKGRVVMPGIIDQHIHVTGGGGEGGPVTRCPELKFSDLVKAGTTSVVGVCGTDTETRSIANLLAKVRALASEGVSTWMWTSNYAMPPTTVTGTVRRDLLAIPECIGVKIALGDHRSSFPTEQEVMHLLSDIRVGGMISGKTGFLHIHLGDMGNVAYDILDGCVSRGMPIKHIRPTHCQRHPETWARSLAFARRGGVIDLTCRMGIHGDAAHAAADALGAGVAAERITLSTDGYGSMPRFDEKGEMVGLTVCPVTAIWDEFKTLSELCGLERAIRFVSTNLALNLGLSGKGVIAEGADADLLILDDAMDKTEVMARGRFLMRSGEILVRGTFEE